MIFDLHVLYALMSISTMTLRGNGLVVAKEPLTITIDPDSELGRALDETADGSVTCPPHRPRGFVLVLVGTELLVGASIQARLAERA